MVLTSPQDEIYSSLVIEDRVTYSNKATIDIEIDLVLHINGDGMNVLEVGYAWESVFSVYLDSPE